MQASPQVADAVQVRTLGRDLGPAGRLARVVAGLAGMGAGGWLAVADGVSVLKVAAIGGYLVLIAGFYLALAAVLGPRRLARIGPWTATTVFLTPVVALGLLPGVPSTLRAAVALYYGVSLLVIAAIRYGGCEVVGIPMALLRRREVVYCPLNAVDAVERPLGQLPHRPAALVAAGLVVVGVVVLAVDEILVGAGWLPVDARWATVLLMPAIVVLARHAWRARSGGSARPGIRTGSGLGALTLAGAALVISLTGSVALFFTGVLVVLLVGGVVAAVRQVLAGRTEPPEPARS